MANQSPDRRKLLEMLARTAALSQLPGFVRWVHADQSDGSPRAGNPVYQPRFFKPEEYAAVERLTDLIIPADETPGAHDAGVAEFVDFMAANEKELQTRFRAGLQHLDEIAASGFGKPFIGLPHSQQVRLLQGIVSSEFFRLIREYTVMGFYTSRIGLEQLQYPGLRMYAQSPGCPHKGDPEHAHLAGAEG